ncbi:MAG: sugar phosphate isomerase/epimerase [Clostridia bacterium]|nr:sugar phosphate isomerase/epimerase [Clostridia bacterium]
MKIGIEFNLFNSGYCRYGDKKYLKLKEHGFSCIDFNMSNTNTEIYTSSAAEELLLHEKALADEAGIEIYQTHGPWRSPPRDGSPEDRAERMEKMKKSIRFTSLLGCKNWVIHPLMPLGAGDMLTGNERETWDINLMFMRELLITAKKYGITICLENIPMAKFSMAKPAAILNFVEEINDENFKICLDTGHVSVFDDLSLCDEVRRLGDKIKVVHIHDNKCGKDLHLMPYFGTIDWKAFAHSLKDIGYDGVFSLETVAPNKMPDSLFERSSIMLYEIANEIINSGEQG